MARQAPRGVITAGFQEIDPAAAAAGGILTGLLNREERLAALERERIKGQRVDPLTKLFISNQLSTLSAEEKQLRKEMRRVGETEEGVERLKSIAAERLLLAQALGGRAFAPRAITPEAKAAAVEAQLIEPITTAVEPTTEEEAMAIQMGAPAPTIAPEVEPEPEPEPAFVPETGLERELRQRRVSTVRTEKEVGREKLKGELRLRALEPGIPSDIREIGRKFKDEESKSRAFGFFTDEPLNKETQGVFDIIIQGQLESEAVGLNTIAFEEARALKNVINDPNQVVVNRPQLLIPAEGRGMQIGTFLQSQAVTFTNKIKREEVEGMINQRNLSIEPKVAFRLLKI